MGWPGHMYDIAGSQALYTKIMTEAANRLGVQLEANQVPLESPADMSGLLEQLKKEPPDGIIVTLMHMNFWGQVNHFVKQKGDLPAVVFSPLGMAFTGHLQETRNAPKTFVASTQDVAVAQPGSPHVQGQVGDEAEPHLHRCRREGPRRGAAHRRHHAPLRAAGALAAGARQGRHDRRDARRSPSITPRRPRGSSSPSRRTSSTRPRTTSSPSGSWPPRTARGFPWIASGWSRSADSLPAVHRMVAAVGRRRGRHLRGRPQCGISHAP